MKVLEIEGPIAVKLWWHIAKVCGGRTNRKPFVA